jgi:beta-N-acetylhexosaminidase
LTNRRGLAAVLAGVLVVATASAGAARSPSLERLVGQAIVTGFDGREPSAWFLARIRAGQVGGVVLFGRNIGSDSDAGRLVRTLQDAAAAGRNPPLLITVDQEGGTVERLPDGPPHVSPHELGDRGDPAEVRAAGTSTGAFLHGLGIDVDLAPVLDTPSSPSSWLGARPFSDDAGLNATLGSAFIAGLQVWIAATAKHFPGLGAAPTTTDTSVVVVRKPRELLDAGLAPFRAAVRAGVDLVMVSNAGYPAYDPSGAPAVCSRAIVTGLLRGTLGYRGAVISDDLEAPGPVHCGGAAVEAMRAGVDLLLYGHARASAAAYEQLVAAARGGGVSLATLEASARRVAALKQRLAHR